MSRFLCLAIFIITVSCAKKGPSKTQQITTYYNGFKTGTYSQVKKTLADSLTLIEGEYATPFTPDSFYEQFKWDSVFKPEYNVIAIDDSNDTYIATISVASPKFKFLKNDPLICKYQFYFDDKKIDKIVNVGFPNANWELWQQHKDTLMDWVEAYHPELDGFMHDLTMKGAVNYMKAIKLYEESAAVGNE